MDALTNGVTIISDEGVSYHSFNDFGLAIGNTNYIEEPEYETHYVPILGRNGFLDLSEVIAGRPIYKNREIKIEFGGINPEAQWDGIISDMRNLFHGHVVKLIFDNDSEWYWTGRAEIDDFDRFRNLGTFTLEIPKADPFKYSVDNQSDLSGLAITTSNKNITTPVTALPVHPLFLVSNLQNIGTDGYMRISLRTSTSEVTYHDITATGTYRFPDMTIEDGEFIRAKMSAGTGTLSIQYRQESL